MQQIQTASRRVHMRRALSLLLAAVMMLGLVPVFPAAQASAHWADPYLSQLMEWGVINQTQAANPDRALTRADFMGIVNRAYGYETPGVTPFEDVKETDWYYDDVGIAYTARYIKGTSPTTASPKDPLTRETAATILGRNMMLEDSAGEILDFIDARNISTWAKGTIKSSLEHYLVSGYDDGTFRPQRNVSWGEMASMVTRLIGTPLQEPGDYALGGTFGNVTITSPGVTLRDTVVSGDLYITGGVGLGGVQLENVTVLGRIIASGTGTSEGGASILLRNVTADELLVDNLQDNEVSIRADGITEIGNTTVRTSAYIEDNTPEGLGLHMISLEGESYPEGEEPEDWVPAKLTLAGRIEEVVNRTPNSTVHAAKGTVSKLTVDEAAVGSNVIIDRGTVVKDLILDTAVEVTGEGDVTRLEVNAPGCVVEMLPDEIVIRPGITAEIHGEEMDSSSADEFRLEPLILSGYPKAKNVAPTTADAVFSTNKKGTIHWAVSAITDGSVGADDLLEPPAYGSIALRYGTLVSPRGNEETIAKITGLLPDGSYYLSALLEDDRGEISPVKVISFTTPDNTVPAFNSGYPRMFDTSRTNSQAVVSANKSCLMYYVLYPEGATPPTTAELKAGSVTGNLGYGVHELEKNTEFTFQVNDRTLEEQKNYVVYFWLTDANGVNSSAITNLTFTTADETPPYFLDGYPQVERFTNNSVTLKFRINEDGRVFWVIRPEGDLTYPQPEPGQTGTAPLDSLYAKTQVSSENPAIAARANTDGRINITGLQPETAYDLYYLCQDNAGNYALRVEKMTIHTADGQGPTFIRQYFGVEETTNPKADDDVCLEFSENLCSSGSIQTDFLTLYQDLTNSTDRETAVANFVTALKESIVLYRLTSNGPVRVKDPLEDPDNWGIDYSKIKVEKVSGSNHLKLTFPTAGSEPALRLTRGSTYHFVFSKLTDNATPKNPMVDAETNETVNSITAPDFTVDFATVALSDQPNLKDDSQAPQERDKTTGERVTKEETVTNPDGTTQTKKVPVLVPMNDKTLYLRMTPKDTAGVDPTVAYDLLLWNQQTVGYQLYYRILNQNEEQVTKEMLAVTEDHPLSNGLSPNKADAKADAVDDNGWIYLGNTSISTPSGTWKANSLHRHLNKYNQNEFPRLETLSDELIYEFVIVMTKVGTSEDSDSWSGPVDFRAQVVAGRSNGLYNWAPKYEEDMAEFESEGLEGGGGLVISDGYFEWGTDIGDSKIPYFRLNTPQFPEKLNDGTPALTDDKVTLRLALDRGNTEIYYVLGKVNPETGDSEFMTTVKADATQIDAVDANGNPIMDGNGNQLKRWNKYALPGADKDAQGNVPVDPALVPTGGNSGTAPLFKLEEPEQENILDPANWEAMMTDLYGVIPYPGGRSIDFTVTGLDPSTTYYAYFVLKGKSSDPSEVYVYRFSTTAEEKPRIKLSPADISAGSTATPGDMVIQTHIASTGKYWVFAAGAQIEFLNQPFSNICYTAADIGKLLGDTSNTKEVPAIYKKNTFTVLDALTTAYRSTASGLNPASEYVPAETSGVGYSVFDFFAGSDARSDLYWMIYSPDSQVGTKTSGSLTVGEPAGPREEDWGKYDVQMKLPEHDENRYYLLTYAVSAHGTYQPGEEAKMASFSAKRFGRGDLPQPEVDSVDFTIREGATGTYSGTITVSFKQAVRLHNMYGEAQSMTADNLLKSLYGYNVNLPQQGSVSVVPVPGPGNSSFQLSFANVPGSSSMGFESNYFANLDNEGAPKRLVITWEENARDKTGWAVATWGGVEVGRSSIVYLGEGPNDLELNFSGLSFSNGKYTLTLNGKETPTVYTKTVTGSLNGVGKILAVSVSPTNTDSKLANTAVTNKTDTGFSLTFTGKAIGTEESFTVTATVENSDGNVVTVKRVITVSVSGVLTIESFTANDTSSKITGSGLNYTWDRQDKDDKAAEMTISAGKNIVDINSVSITSSNPTCLAVGTYRLQNGKIIVPLRYLSKAVAVNELTIKVGNQEQTVTVTLTGVSDSGTTAVKPNPF